MATPHARRVALVVGAALALLAWLWSPAEPPSPEAGAAASRAGWTASFPRSWSADPSAEPGARKPADLPHPFATAPVVLANGVTLIVVEDHAEPTIAAHVAFGVGASDDPPELPGTAHLLEHLMFSGTRRLGTADWRAEAPAIDDERELSAWLADETDPDAAAELEDALAEAHAAADARALPGEFQRLLDEIGATRINAFTSLEVTDFEAVIPPNALERWAVVLAEELSDPVLRRFVDERAVVEEELRLGTASSCASSLRALVGAVFAGHPYGTPIVGSPEGLRRAHVAELEAFHDAWYTPGNAAVVLVGDLDPEEAREIAERTFGRWEPRPSPVRSPLPSVSPLTRVVHVGEGTEREQFLGWALPELRPGDLEALRVFAAGLPRAAEAELPRGTRMFEPTVAILELARGGMLDISHWCPEDPERCERVILGAIRRIGQGELTGDDVVAARQSAWVSHLRRLESHEAQATELVYGWSRGEPPEARWRHLVAMRTVTAPQVVEVVRRLLDPYHYAITRGHNVWPPDPTPGSATVHTDVDDQRISSFYADVLAMPVPGLEPRWRLAGVDWTGSADGRVIAVPNPSNTLFQADLVWPIGWRRSPAICSALTNWLVDRYLPGAGRWGMALRQLGVTIDLRDCQWNAVTLRLDGPGEAAAPALRTIEAELARPRLDPSSRHYGYGGDSYEALWRALLYGPLHPPDQPWLERLTDEDLVDALRAFAAVSPDVWYTGPDPAERVASMIRAGGRVAPEPPPPVVPAGAIDREPGARHEVIVVREGEPYDPQREALYQLYARWLSGPSGIVTERVRFGEGAAYDIKADYLRGRIPGEPNVTRISVSTDRVDAVLAALKDVLGRTTDDARWERVRATTEEQLWSGYVPFREAPSRIAAWRDRGFDGDPREFAWSALPDVDRDGFDRFLADEAARPLRIIVR